MAARNVVIEHRDGRRYAVPVKAFHDLYEHAGFKIQHYEDGEPYQAPKPKPESKDKD